MYYCKADPRVIVPKGAKWMGWTMNFAQPLAFPVLALLLAILCVPYAAVKAFGAGPVLSGLCLPACIGLVCLICAHFSSPKRWTRRG